MCVYFLFIFSVIYGFLECNRNGKVELKKCENENGSRYEWLQLSFWGISPFMLMYQITDKIYDKFFLDKILKSIYNWFSFIFFLFFLYDWCDMWFWMNMTNFVVFCFTSLFTGENKIYDEIYLFCTSRKLEFVNYMYNIFI